MKGHTFILICALAITKGDRLNNGHHDPSKAPEICAAEESNGVLVAHKNCNQFYICNAGVPVAFKCHNNLNYNTNSEFCDWPVNVDCGDRTISEEENGDDQDSSTTVNDDPNQAAAICAANDSEGVMIAHENCNQYYKCSGGIPVAYRCQGHLFYDPSKQYCDCIGFVVCGDRHIPESDKEDDGSDSNENGESDNCNPSEAPKICASGNSEGMLVAHEKCNKFYQCSHGTPVSIKCPGNLLFNPKAEICDWPENVECGDRTIPEGDNENNENDGSGDNDDSGNDDDSGDTGSPDNENDDNSDSGIGSCNCNPSEAPTICASEGSEGVLVAHEKCNKFYTCSQGKPVTIGCPGGLLYNPWDQVCDWPENVKCEDRVIPGTNDNEDTGDSDSGDVGSGDNDNSDNDGTDNGNNDNGNGAGNCDPTAAPKICAANKSDGILVAHEKCNKFYRCDQGKPIPIECPGSLLFNPAKDACDWPENVKCGDRIIPEEDSDDNNNGDVGSGDNGNDNDSNDNGNGDNDNGNGSCNCNPGEAPKICASEDSEGVLVAHEKCDKFYTCSEGKPITIRCPDGLLYNPWDQVCDWSENVKCGDRVISEEGSEENDNDDVGTGDNDNDNENDNGNNIDCHDDPSQAPIICAATGSEGGFVAHENCNQFYICSEGKPSVLSCQNNLLYNPKIQACDWPQNVNCGDRAIPGEDSEDDSGDNGNDNGSENDNIDDENGDNDINIDCHDDPSQAPAICAAADSEGVLIAHENCNQFYVCSEGKPSVLSCQNSLLYNPKIPACDWPQNVNCGDRVIPEEDSEDDSGDNGTDNESDNDNSGNENGDNGNNIDCHDDPSQAPAICAAADSEGVLIAHENCNQFYKCSEGKPTVLSCLNNLLYNPRIQACDLPENVNCGDRVIPEEDREDDAADSGIDNESDNGNDNESDNDDTDDENGDDDNNIGSHDDPSQAPAICEAAGSKGVLVAHENCNQFYKCSEGKPTVLSCLNNLLYNPRIQACDLPENVNCGDRVIPEDDREDDAEDNGNDNESDNGNDNESDNDDTDNENGDDGNNIGSHDDPSQAPAICAAAGSKGVIVAHENCNQFYKCSEGKPTVLSCLNNLLYNPRIQACDLPENVNCGDRVIPEEDREDDAEDNGNDNESDNGNDNESDNDNSGNENGDNGNNIGSHDDPSQAPVICAATGSEGVIVAHENCNQFYVCSEGKPSAVSCPNNLFYDPKTQECDWPENVNCLDRLIPAEDEEDNSSVDADEESDNSNSGDDDDGYEYYYSSNAAAVCAAPGSDGVLIEHANCHQFYLCSAGMPIVLDCALNQLYNAETKQCDWQENIKCGNRFIPSDDSRSMSIALNKHLVSRKALRH